MVDCTWATPVRDGVAASVAWAALASEAAAPASPSPVPSAVASEEPCVSVALATSASRVAARLGSPGKVGSSRCWGV